MARTLQQYVDEFLDIEKQKKALTDKMNVLTTEAKDDGLDPRALRRIVQEQLVKRLEDVDALNATVNQYRRELQK